MNPIRQENKAQKFYSLHQGQNILILPNAWDASSARLFEQAGFHDICTRVFKRFYFLFSTQRSYWFKAIIT